MDFRKPEDPMVLIAFMQAQNCSQYPASWRAEYGEEMRRVLMEDNRRLQGEKDAAIERAHKAELELVSTSSKLAQIEGRLTRKDEALKALQNQVIDLGARPVYMTAPAGRSDGA